MRSATRTEPSIPVAPRYGVRSLSDVLPSVLGALGVPGCAGPLQVPAARSACVLLLDGLGWELLTEHAADAPHLAALAQRSEPLDAGFPATTATNITSLTTGRPPGEHGIVGYTFAGPTGEVLNALTWRSRGGVDLRDTVPPEELQCHPTALQRAAAAGLAVRVIGPAAVRRSGLTRAALRGAEYHGVHALGDLTAGVLAALEGRALCYAYLADLDVMGHSYGPGSTPWRLQLAHLDHLVAAIAGRLCPGALLCVVADHGMATLADPVDADADLRLRCGVRLIAGDVRARYVYTEPGAADDVLAAWREVLGERAWVVSRAEAVAAGWFGPSVLPAVLPRIGDVVVAARGHHGVVQSAVEPRQTAMVGHHGSLTPADQLVPFLLSHSRR
ncbi:MAG: alkaline phosphatase family protein [Pseudonocardiaceae bacterium]